jgi:hypothetical protein
LGLSHSQFDELTPLELDFALKDHADYFFAYEKYSMSFHRYFNVLLYNKGLKRSSMVRSPKRLWKFPWEFAKEVKIPTKTEWKMLDKKYKRKS